MSHPNCPACQLNQYVIKAGLNRSRTQRYRCQNCTRYFTPQPKPSGYDPQIRKPAVQFYLVVVCKLFGKLFGCLYSIITLVSVALTLTLNVGNIA